MSRPEAEVAQKNGRTALQRKRVEQACDQCCRSKARCDGREPCQHCEDYSYVCEYTRERRKRGRRPNSANRLIVAASSRRRLPTQKTCPDNRIRDRGNGSQQSEPGGPQAELGNQEGDGNSTRLTGSPVSQSGFPMMQVPLVENYDHYHFELGEDIPRSLNINPFLWNVGSGLDSSTETHLDATYSNLNVFQDSSNRTTRLDPRGRECFPEYCKSSSSSTATTSPNSVSTQVTQASVHGSQPDTGLINHQCRYSVILPLVPYITHFLPVSTACDLLDLYFTEPSNSLFACSSPYVITQIFRKDSFLNSERPRKTSKALLAAMLWVTSQTSDFPIFTDDPTARGSICDKLYLLCLRFLSSPGLRSQQPSCENELHLQKGSHIRDYRHSPSALDDIITYALIGLVVSGRESRKDCLAWWNQAWALAKDLNLNREFEETNPGDANDFGRDNNLAPSNGEDLLTLEEAKEERRRVWWLLYIADRHLALCYNTPLKVLDVECHIYQPLNDTIWQNLDCHLQEGLPPRYHGPITTMIGVGLFEFFLPLMAILGDIIDIHHQRLHPRLGLLDQSSAIMQVEQCLALYERSLQTFEESVTLRYPDIGQSLPHSSPQTIFNACREIQPWTTEETRLKTVIGYSNYLLHVLHILLHGNWDPLSMLDGVTPWITPQIFTTCSSRAISAATAVSEIFKVDPELSFMPYLFGIYLLHGSFSLLIFADRMDVASSDVNISRAYETMIRAHEVCVTTLNTGYQRTFRKVLRSALNALRGTITPDMDKHQGRRREFLNRYRWDRGGKGLAI